MVLPIVTGSVAAPLSRHPVCDLGLDGAGEATELEKPGCGLKSKTGRSVPTVPIFLLMPQVRLRERLVLLRDAVSAADGLPQRIVTG